MVKLKDIILVGGGGHAKVIIDIIRSREEFKVIGIVDNDLKKKQIYGIPVVGTDEILEEIFRKQIATNAFVSFDGVKRIEKRGRMFFYLKKIGYEIPILVHEKAIVSDYAEIGEGTCVMAGSIINAGSVIKENCIINTGAIIEHDCYIGFNSHIAPNASLAGGVIIGDHTHIGIGSVVIENVKIGNNVVVGAGAVVTKDVPDNVIVAGIPAKIIRENC